VQINPTWTNSVTFATKHHKAPIILTAESLVPAREPTAFDGWRSISLSLIMTLVGYGVMVGIIDPKGSFSALMPGAQGLGQIVGPNIAGSLLGAQLGYSAVFIMCASATIGGLLMYALMHWRLRIASPMLAETAGKFSAALP
jgi:hypothetical protein